MFELSWLVGLSELPAVFPGLAVLVVSLQLTLSVMSSLASLASLAEEVAGGATRPTWSELSAAPLSSLIPPALEIY